MASAGDAGWLLYVAGARLQARAVKRWHYDLHVNGVPQDLPGHELVSRGLDDLAQGRESEEGLVVSMAAPRLRRIGFEVPDSNVELPSHRLYELLSDAYGDGYSRYKALIARMVSFARAAEHATRG